MNEVTGLAYMLDLSVEQVTAIMKRLEIPVNSPDYILTNKDVKKIKKYLRRNNSSILKDTIVAAVAIMSVYFMFSPIGNFIMSIGNNEPLTFSTPISLENEDPIRSFSPHYYMLSNECTPVDYADTDFLVVENIKEFLSNEGYYSGTINEVFDEELKDSVKDFQKDMGIRIDGVVGPTTHKIMQNYNSCTKKSIENLISCYGGDYKAYLECTSPYESSGILTTTTLDSHPPKWAEDPLTIININSSWMSPNVMRATVLWGHVTDDVGIDEYQIYVDGKLYTTIPGLNCKTKCSSQSSGRNARISDLVKDSYHTIEVRACDEAGNCSTNNPTITKEFKETVVVTTTTTTTLPGTPTIAITASQVSDGDTSSDSSLSITFTTSASTANFAAGDVVVSGGTLSNFSGSGTTYTATFTPSAAGATTIDVAGGTFTNAQSVNNVAATQFNWTYVLSQKLADCGDSTTSANRWVVSVIDEDSSFYSPPANTVWNSFRGSYPDRCFHLLGPGTPVSSINLRTGELSYNGVSWADEVTAGTAFRYQVNRDSGNTASRSDWWDLIGADVLPSGAKIALCVDNSGSMTVTTVQASVNYFVEQATAAGVTIFAPSGGTTTYNCSGMNSEDWISGHNVAMN